MASLPITVNLTEVTVGDTQLPMEPLPVRIRKNGIVNITKANPLAAYKGHKIHKLVLTGDKQLKVMLEEAPASQPSQQQAD
jgi:hypothetical protein